MQVSLGVSEIVHKYIGVGFWYNWKPWNVLFKDKQNEIFLYDASENLDTGELSNVQDHNICLIECK